MDPEILNCCCLCLCTSVEVWGTTGGDACFCCWGCCDSSEGRSNEHLRKEQAKDGATAQPIDSQPLPMQNMSTTVGDSDLRPINAPKSS